MLISIIITVLQCQKSHFINIKIDSFLHWLLQSTSIYVDIRHTYLIYGAVQLY